MKNKNYKLGLIMALYLLGIFMGAVDTGIVSPARTIIQNGLSVDEKTGIWMITIYTLAYAAVIPIAGKLADKLGRKYVYIISVALFGTGSIICGLSSASGSFTILLIGRVIQAMGGGGIVPIATAEFGTTFPEEKRGMALGLVGAVYGIANIIGSSIGSLILKIFGNANWHWLFFVNIPICIFIIIGGLLYIPNHKFEKVKKIDKIGTVILVVMTLSILYGLRNIDFFDFYNSVRSIEVYPYLLAFFALFPIFVIAEKKAEDPIMNLSYFTNPRISITLLLSVIVGVSMMGMVFVPQFSENALKIPSGTGGYFVAILGVFAGVGAPLSGKLIDKYGAKKVLLLGFFITMLGALFIVLVSVKVNNIATVVTSLILIGLGMGFTIGTPLNYMMLENTKLEESNSALATLSLVRSLGTAIAPAIMVGFLAHAGLNVSDSIMNILPQPTSPKIVQVEELNTMIAKMKSNPDTADMLKDVQLPDFNTSSSTKIDMKSGNLPDELLNSLKTADVTNITEKTKEISTYMFDKNTPAVIAKIENGVDTGIDSMNKGIDGITKGQEGLNSGIKGLDTAIAKMNQGVAGMNTAVEKMRSALAGQDAALVQMNLAYSKIIAMTAGAGGSSTTGIPAGIITTSVGMQVGAPTGMPTSSTTGGAPDAKALKAKIDELSSAKDQLSISLNKTIDQKQQLINNISTLKDKKQTMVTALAKMSTEKESLISALNKTKELKTAVPNAFEQSKREYLSSIDASSGKIQQVFQSVLNVGFKQMFLTVFLANLLGLVVLLFYRSPKKV